MSTIVPKPWGKELIFTSQDAPYTGKILYLSAGQRLSLQAHEIKQETLVLFFGQAKLTLGQDKNHLTTNDMTLLEGYTIAPNTIHRIEAIVDSIIFEASTPEKGVTFRLEDDYQRQNETK